LTSVTIDKSLPYSLKDYRMIKVIKKLFDWTPRDIGPGKKSASRACAILWRGTAWQVLARSCSLSRGRSRSSMPSGRPSRLPACLFNLGGCDRLPVGGLVTGLLNLVARGWNLPENCEIPPFLNHKHKKLIFRLWQGPMPLDDKEN